MAFQNQTYANSGDPYYGKPSDWSLFSTLYSTIIFNDTNAKLLVIPAVPDSQTTISFNGEQLAYVSDIPDLANWAQYPANNTVTIPSPYALNAALGNISTINVSTLNVIETNINIINTDIIRADEAFVPIIRSSTISITAERGTSLFPASVSINASNGLYGTIGLTADPGFGGAGGGNISLTANGGTAPGGLYGQVNIIANQGTANPGTGNVTTGGYINIQANSGGIPANPTLTSRIDLNAGGLNLYSGLLSPITSEFGYTFINASLGASIVAGAFSPSFQVPGSVYMYGTNGIVLGSDVYAKDIYPRLDNPLVVPTNLTINGRTTLLGKGFVELNNVDTLSFDTDATANKAISGLSTINGQPLSDFDYNPNPSFSSITVVNDGLIEVTQIRNTYPGEDITIAQENNTGKIAMSVIPPPAVVPIGDITIRETGQIELNGMLGEGITINPTGDILTFQTAGLVPTGQIDGLSTINGNDVNNPVVSTITTNTSGSVKTTLIQNTVAGPDLRIHQKNGDGSLTLALFQVGAGIPTGEIDIADSGVIGLNNMIAGAGITINQAGDTINFETGGNPTGKIIGLSTINSISVTNPIVNVLRANEIQTNSPFLASLMRINMGVETADAITLVHPQSGATRGVKIVESSVGPGILDVGSITSVSSINGIAYPLSIYQATYYKSANQALNGPNAPGNTDITFDLTGSWNNDGGYITHTNGTEDFTVVQTGLYFLEFNANIQGTGVAWTGSKSVNIDITRSPIAEQAVIQQSATQNSGTDYGQCVSATFYLVAGDVINLRVFNIYTSITQPFARGVANTFDLNTFFTWRLISA